VARGFSQKYGIDYKETYAPVVEITSIRILMKVSIEFGLKLHQMDVKTAFLYASLDEEIYMEAPEGYHTDTGVVRLLKSLYGLKQAPKAWYDKLSKYLKSLGFIQGKTDFCIFRKGEEDTLVYILIYVDDLIIACKSEKEIAKLKVQLNAQFKMKDLGLLHWCLGLKIEQKDDSIKVSQRLYVDKVLERFKMSNCKPFKSPIGQEEQLRKHENDPQKGLWELVDRIMYQRAIGSIMYLMTRTRSDLAFPIGLLSRFSQEPNTNHLRCVRRTFRYIKNTRNSGLNFNRTGNLKLIGFADADYDNCLDTRKTVSGYLFTLGGSVISWKSRK